MVGGRGHSREFLLIKRAGSRKDPCERLRVGRSQVLRQLHRTLTRIREGAPMVLGSSPIDRLEEIKTFVFTYILIGPLLSALFAEEIDSRFVVAVIFVVGIGAALTWTRNRMAELEESIRDQERRLLELIREREERSMPQEVDQL